ncbi:hypothetical protein GCM10008934_16390 [Virgibacillus salarius]|uniref:hypothetical protein n=1 Tax=Virgibacillus salarius TaxID=447199 RepID=UPI0031CE9E53
MEKPQKQQRVFMLADDHYRGTHNAMDRFYEVDRSYADQLVNEGKAIKYDSEPELDKYHNDITREVERFRKQYDKLRDSKDPRYKDPDFFREEVSKLRKELDEKVAGLQTDYTTIIQEIREEAQRERANLTRDITQADETGARQLMNELVSDAKLNGIDKAIRRIESNMRYFSEGRKVALANELHRLVELAGDDDKSVKRQLRTLSNQLREDSEGVELAARMANALPDEADTAYRNLKLIHPAYK